MSGQRRTDFTENLDAVARGVRRLDEIRDPILREAVAAALRLRDRQLRLDPAGRARIRNTVLAALAPAKPTLGDRLYGVFAVLGMPAPVLVRSLVIVAVTAGLIGSATVASADSLPDDLLYGVKLAGEQLRLVVAVRPADRASVELSIAEHRLAEAERLATAGREDDAIIATAAYGSSLADAAADLATVESTDTRTAALVTQMQASLAASRLRVAATAMKLAADPRTVNTAEVLDAVASVAAENKDSPATGIADQAAAITAQVAAVASDRANRIDPRHTETPNAAAPTGPGRSTAPRASGVPVQVAGTTTAARATAMPDSPNSTDGQDGADSDSESARTPASTARQAFGPPANPSAARHSADRAKEAAEKALEAAAKAKHAASRSKTPTPPPAPDRR